MGVDSILIQLTKTCSGVNIFRRIYGGSGSSKFELLTNFKLFEDDDEEQEQEQEESRDGDVEKQDQEQQQQ